jgi:hypothetical protein
MKRLSVLFLAVSLLVPAHSAADEFPPPHLLPVQPMIYAGKLAAFGVLGVLFVSDAVLGAPIGCVAQTIGDQSLDGCSAGAQKARAGGKRALCYGFELFSEVWGDWPCTKAAEGSADVRESEATARPG